MTVLFADISGFTALAETLDPEEVRQVMNACFTWLVPVVEYYGGTIDKFIGDEIMALFGAPVAYENDAERAVHTALALMEALTAFNAEYRTDLGLHCGINTGLVIAGGGGTRARQDYSVMGDAVNLAARLEDASARGQIFVGPETYRLTHTWFTFEPLTPRAVKGKAEPVQVYRVLGPAGERQRGLGVAHSSGLLPLVGREAEVMWLLNQWEQVKEGMGQVVVLSGEAGIGKSRLVQELKARLTGEVHTQLECRGSPYHQHTALYPLAELLEREAGWQKDDTPSARLQKLERIVRQHPLNGEALVPLLATLLSLPLLQDPYPPPALSLQRQRQQTLDAIFTLVVGLAERQPVLFLIEDVHWVDPSTLEFLDLLIDRVSTVPILAVLTCRPAFQPAWGLRTHLMPIVLQRLTRPQVEHMVAQVAGGKTLPAEVLQQLVAKTDGVPLFVEEMTKAVLESGILIEREGHYALHGPLPALAIPPTLQDSLMARLDRLGPAKELAQLSAVVGREFPFAVLQAVAPQDEAALQQELARLVDAELLYQRGLPSQTRYLFKHALVQEAAYQSLLKSVRQQYHQRIAQTLAERFPDIAETQPELLAHHFTEAGLAAQALGYWQRAGQRANERSAYREAVACFEQALKILRHLPESHHTREQAIDLRFALRNALHPLGECERVLACLREAEIAAEALGDQRRLGQVFSYMALNFEQMGDPERAIASGQRALAVSAALGDFALQVETNIHLGIAYSALGDYRRAMDVLRKNVELLEGPLIHERFNLVSLLSVTFRALLLLCLARVGAFAEGIVMGAEGRRIAETVDHPFTQIGIYIAVGSLYLYKGDLPQALPVLERGLQLCQNTDSSVFFPVIAADVGAAYALSGRVAEALPLLEQAVQQAATIQHMGGQSYRVAWLSEAHLLAGRTDEAITQALRALELSRKHKERGYEAWVLRLLGEIALRGNPAAVEHL